MSSKKIPTDADAGQAEPSEAARADDLSDLLERLRRARATNRAVVGHAQRVYAYSQETRAWYMDLQRIERQIRLAALNLMEDAAEARMRGEREAVARDRAEAAERATGERLRLILDNALDYAIIALDLDRRVTSWSAGAAAILGYQESDVLGESCDLIFTEEDREDGIPRREAAAALAHGRASDERWHVRRDGRRFWASGVMMPMRDAAGDAVGFVKIFRDQTAEVNAKNALAESRARMVEALAQAEQARAEAEAAGQAKDYFLAVLSHELRTPLTPVLLALQMLERRRDLPRDVQQVLATVRRNVQLEARFVDELLDVTKIAHGKLELLRQPMDLHEAVARAVDVCLPEIDAKGQRLDVALDATRHHIDGDFARLQQAVWNLLKNASKFSAGGGRIRLRTFDAPGSVGIEVNDEGIGIEPATLAHIFEPFNQADRAITRRFGGLGLGLAIAQATVAAHGGEIRAQSEGPERGATFTVVLPLATSAPATPA